MNDWNRKLTYCPCGKEAEYKGEGRWYDKCHDCWWEADPRNPKHRAEKARASMAAFSRANAELRRKGIIP